MEAQARFFDIAFIVALTMFILWAGAASAQDLSSYSGAQLYSRFCANCHGEHGRGDGPVAASFKLVVPDLTRIAERHDGVFPIRQVRKIIDGRRVLPPHGSQVMPVWGFEFYAQNSKKRDPQQRTGELVTRLAEHLRSIQKK